MRPKVLVLLAAFNGSDWIIEQVDSILAQVDVDLSLLIGDDGSTDDTLNLLKPFASDHRVRIVSSPAPTGSAAQNFLQLIRSTSGDGYDYVAFADQDDIWHREKLLRGCSTLAQGKAAGYSCAVSAFWKDGQHRILRQVGVLTQSDFLFEGAGQGCTFVITDRFYTQTRAFLIDHMPQTASLHFHDWAMYALSRSWGLTWSFDPEPMVSYRQHENNDTGARASSMGVSRRLRLIREGWYLRQLQCIAELCGAAAADDPIVNEWRGLLAMPRGLARKIRLAKFCLEGGRRRRLDRTILVAAAIAGWI